MNETHRVNIPITVVRWEEGEAICPRWLTCSDAFTGNLEIAIEHETIPPNRVRLAAKYPDDNISHWSLHSHLMSIMHFATLHLNASVQGPAIDHPLSFPISGMAMAWIPSVSGYRLSPQLGRLFIHLNI